VMSSGFGWKQRSATIRIFSTTVDTARTYGNIRRKYLILTFQNQNRQTKKNLTG
jgi:hypothetical protein